MMGRTPPQNASVRTRERTSPIGDRTEGAGPPAVSSRQDTQVRRSIGEIEARSSLPGISKPTGLQLQTSKKQDAVMKPAALLDHKKSPKIPAKYKNKTLEAKACLMKVKMQIEKSRNLKTEIKEEVLEAVDRLYILVKEAELTKQEVTPKTVPPLDQSALANRLEEHSRQLVENTRRMEELQIELQKQKERLESTTYASVVAQHPKIPANLNRETLHSVVVTSTDNTETGEEVLDRVRRVVDAKDGWITVQHVRKARDRKVIMGFKTTDEQRRMKDRLGMDGSNLIVEEIKNKDPLLVLKDVLLVNTDEEVLRAVRNQNKDMFYGLDEGENRLEIKYRKKARNPHTGHIIISTSPKIWRRAVEAGALHVDLQRVRVSDQSPLVQCSRCLEYGHGRRFCKEEVDLCSHCGGPHLKTHCPEWLSNVAPSCRNCTKAKMDNTEHNAFSGDCPVRKRWDKLARSSVAYC